MKTTIHRYLLIPALLLAYTACNSLDPHADDFTDEELQIASQIIGESLSEESGGFMSTIYDALSNVEQDRMVYGGERRKEILYRPEAPNNGPGNGRGSESEYNASYNPETGEHIVSFRRSHQGPNQTITLSVLNKYIYTDIDGAFLEFPRRQSDQIETIDFKGVRQGTNTTLRRSSSFTRSDTLLISGISTASEELTLEGVHRGEGRMEVNLPRLERSQERSYLNRFVFQDIRIDKALVQENGSLEEGVTGLITYELKMKNTVNGETRERDISGVIELTGDGTALLRFNRVSQFFVIGLRSGETRE